MTIFIAITSCLFEHRKAFNNPNTASLIKAYGFSTYTKELTVLNSITTSIKIIRRNIANYYQKYNQMTRQYL